MAFDDDTTDDETNIPTRRTEGRARQHAERHSDGGHTVADEPTNSDLGSVTAPGPKSNNVLLEAAAGKRSRRADPDYVLADGNTGAAQAGKQTAAANAFDLKHEMDLQIRPRAISRPISTGSWSAMYGGPPVESQSTLALVATIPPSNREHRSVNFGHHHKLRSIATALADGFGTWTCSTQRKRKEREIFEALRDLSTNSEFYERLLDTVRCSLRMHQYDDDVVQLETRISLEQVDEHALALYIDFWLRTMFPTERQDYSLVVVEFSTALHKITGAHRIIEAQAADATPLAFRRIDGCYWEAYAHVLDASDISCDGQPDADVQYLRRFDPRFANLEQDHVCVDESTCSESGRRHLVAKQMADYASRGMTPSDREEAMAEAVFSGCLVNPATLPNGLGVWRWLDDFDWNDAQARGFQTPGQVARARAAGTFRAVQLSDEFPGMAPVNDYEKPIGPTVVFSPYQPFVNPRHQPFGTGGWRFLTQGSKDSAEERARAHFSDYWGFRKRPSAHEIWNIRQENPSLVSDVDLVWMPYKSPEEMALLSSLSDDHLQLFWTLDVPAESKAQLFSSCSFADFSEVHRIIHTWSESFFYSQENQVNGLLPLPLVLSLTMNDFVARSEKPLGRFCYLHGNLSSDVILYADRAWSTPELNDWSRKDPRERLKLCGTSAEWHWNRPDTKVFAILVVFAEPEQDGNYLVTLSLRRELFQMTRRGDISPLVLVCTPFALSIEKLSNFLARDDFRSSVLGDDFIIIQCTLRLETIRHDIPRGPDMPSELLTTLHDMYCRSFEHCPGALDGELMQWSDISQDLIRGDQSIFHKPEQSQSLKIEGRQTTNNDIDAS